MRANTDVEDCVRQQVDDWMNGPVECECKTAHDRAQDDVDDWLNGSCAKRGLKDKWRNECTSESSDGFDFDDEFAKLKKSCFGSEDSCSSESEYSCSSESESSCSSDSEEDCKLFKKEPRKQSICLKPRVDEVFNPIGCDIPIPKPIGDPNCCFNIPLPVAIGEPGNCFNIPLPKPIGDPDCCFNIPLPVEIG